MKYSTAMAVKSRPPASCPNWTVDFTHRISVAMFRAAKMMAARQKATPRIR